MSDVPLGTVDKPAVEETAEDKAARLARWASYGRAETAQEREARLVSEVAVATHRGLVGSTAGVPAVVDVGDTNIDTVGTVSAPAVTASEADIFILLDGMKSPYNYDVNTSIQSMVSISVEKLGFSAAFVSWLMNIDDWENYYVDSSNTFAADRAEYAYEQYLIKNPSYDDTYELGQRGGAEPTRALALDVNVSKQAYYQALSDANLADRATQEAQLAATEATNHQLELLNAQMAANQALESENLFQYFGRILSAPEGATRSWDYFFSSVFPTLVKVGTLGATAATLAAPALGKQTWYFQDAQGNYVPVTTGGYEVNKQAIRMVKSDVKLAIQKPTKVTVSQAALTAAVKAAAPKRYKVSKTYKRNTRKR